MKDTQGKGWRCHTRRAEGNGTKLPWRVGDGEGWQAKGKHGSGMGSLATASLLSPIPLKFLQVNLRQGRISAAADMASAFSANPTPRILFSGG